MTTQEIWTSWIKNWEPTSPGFPNFIMSPEDIHSLITVAVMEGRRQGLEEAEE